MTPIFIFPIDPSILLFTFKSLPVLISLATSRMQMHDYILSRGATINLSSSSSEIFDFIVVGGGSAGSVVAARLSEDPKVRVLLLEAGGDPNPYSYVPAFTGGLQLNSDTDWMYETMKQNGSAEGLKGNKALWPRGKCLGGSSGINYMIYMRGNPNDFDRWAEHSNDSRWSYREMEEYFEKMEDYDGQWERSGYHGKGGPLHIETVSSAPGFKNLMKAAKEMGFENRDLNQNQKQGFSKLDLTLNRGFRHSTFSAYIQPALHRSNLVIYRYSHVTKIDFDSNNRAVGVSFVRHGAEGHYAKASKEIILSAGAINTPQLLMLSGIGPRKHLEEKGIPLVADLPVGQNLQDHVSTLVGPYILNRTSSSFKFQESVDVGSVIKLFMNGTGPLTLSGGIAAGLASSSKSSSDWPDIMINVISLGMFPKYAKDFSTRLNLDKDGENFLAAHEGQGRDAHLIIVALGLPKSRGYIQLKDRNPFSKPIINPRYFSDEKQEDIQVIAEGVDIVRRMYENTTAMQKLGARILKSYPGCEHLQLRGKLYNECLVRRVSFSSYHPSGTCSMGKPDDPGTVVDSKLRILGVKGLRVADASVMPFVTNANTNAPAIAIGEACADIIKEDWRIK